MASSSNGSNLTPAEQLRMRHAANEPHNPTVEDVVDEEDVQHPPALHASSDPVTASSSSDPTGKPPVDVPSRPKKAPLNVNSEEAFPSLGPSKPAPVAASHTWSRKPASTLNGSANTPTNGSSQASQARARNAPAQGGNSSPSNFGLSNVSLPGRAVERVAFAPQQITPRHLLKKPIPEVLREINKRSKAQVVVKEGPGGQIIFEGTGPQDAVRQALKEVANQVGSKQSIKIAVPLAVRPFLIGKQGQTIQGITKRTGARINIPKQDEPVNADDEDATIDITVEGDAVSAEMARREVQKIINERTSSQSMSLKDIPPEFYPFLIGAREANLNKLRGSADLNINIPSYHVWSGAPPTQPQAQGKPASFVPQPSLPIRISGDRQAAQQARERIDRQVEALRRQLTSHQLPIERGRHQFIVGQNGDALHDLIEETGCSVIVPPSNDDTETLYIIGPPDKIESAVNKVMDVAASMAVSNVDVARQHARAPPAHAHNLGRYLRERQAIAELERQYAASIVLPVTRDSPANWQIFSQDGKQGMRARTDALNLIAAHPPSRFQSMDVNPFYHNHLQRQAPQIRREHGVHILFPLEDPESQELVLVYEAPGSPSEYSLPRQPPSAAEIKEHQQSVQAALKYLNSIVGNNKNVVSQHFEAPPKYHEKVQRYVDREQRNLPEGQIPPQLLFGKPAPKSSGPGFHIRGPATEVDALNAMLLAFIEQEKKDELERGFTMSFEYPHKFASHLIGRKGDNIKKLQDEFDIEINYTEGKIELKGPKAKCEACKSHILSNAKKLEDEATHQIKVPAQYHYDLKGPKGSQVMRLQDRYNVRINFPRQQHVADDADAATESSFRGQPTQAPDVVVIKGPRKGADEAREELLNLLQYVQDNSHTATVAVASKQVPSLIGAGGRELDSLRNETKCRIDMPKKEEVEANSRVEIKLKGTKKQVEDAKKLLLERAKEFDNTVSESMEIDPKFYKTIIGPSGSTLSKIVLDAGGPEDRRQMNRMVTFPKQGSNESSIKIQGPKAVVQKIITAIRGLVSEKDGQVVESVNVPPEMHRHLIGPGGSTRRKLEEDFKVEINIPRADTSGPERANVKISGQPEDVAKVKSHIDSLIKEQASETIEVPVGLHHIVSDDGNIFRRLRNDHGITVDHAGKKPPAKSSTAGASRGRANGGGASMPLITDDPEDVQNSHSWELQEPEAVAEGEGGNIPWVLRGNEDNLAKARKLIEQAISNASKPTSTGYLILPDPKMYRFVIGQGGSTINSIRKQTNVQIQVPKQGSGSEAIEIKGPKEGVLKAKDLVLEAVENGIQNGGQGGRRRG
ncbi:hypothetical protein BT63DRAFT_386720 [Microthyrium microscopicum]|uniref:K Homology domain-containing protein n=1 Tax=Microthyrium microscopicum TaxID=703497 RepID=A0A6A6UFK1_9PEZI|nr:hypothetical protein BT63DRAFT_386720 [Microthyrium microscopicum]